MKAKFGAMQVLLYFANTYGDKMLQVLGDSKTNGKNDVQAMLLNSLLQQICESIQMFECASFTHIYKELNVKAYQLSKEVLMVLNGTFVYHEYLNGNEVEAMEFH